MNLTEWAHVQGIHVTTAYRWYREGHAARSGAEGRPADPGVPRYGRRPPAGRAGLYARVSSHDQKADLDRQVARLSAWAAQAGLPVVRVEAEVGSGMNGARPKARRLLADPARQP